MLQSWGLKRQGIPGIDDAWKKWIFAWIQAYYWYFQGYTCLVPKSFLPFSRYRFNNNNNNNLVWWHCHRVALYKMWYKLKSACSVLSMMKGQPDLKILVRTSSVCCCFWFIYSSMSNFNLRFVAEVIDLVRTVNGFRSLTCYFSSYNFWVHNTQIKISEVTEKHTNIKTWNRTKQLKIGRLNTE